MAVLIPTKKIPELTAYGVALAGPEMLEISVTGTSRRITARDFVLPIDSVLTVTPLGVVGSNSRQLTAGVGIAFVDGGSGSTLQVNATGAVAGPANPTAQVGLAPVNGALLTYMRSDAAPALDQSIAPTWTGNHIFAANTNQVRNSVPQWVFVETDAAADNQAWPIRVSGEQFTIGALNDIGSVFTPWVSVDRTGTVIDLIALASTGLTWNGSPLLTAATAFANPTATIGLAVVNGVATTAMRSDAAPALSQAIAPTWTAQHIFSLSGATNAAILVSSAQPQVDWNETDAAANNRRWRFEAQTEQFLGRVVNDANSAAVTWLAVDRTLNVVDSVVFTVGSNDLTIGSSITTTAGQLQSTKIWSLGNGINYGVRVNSTAPAMAWQETDAAANNGVWDIIATGEQFLFRTVADGVVSTVNWMTVDRTGTTVDSVGFPSSPVEFLNPSGHGFVISRSGAPSFRLNQADGAANNRLWDFAVIGEQLNARIINDAISVATSWMTVDRTGTVVDNVIFPTVSDGAFRIGAVDAAQLAFTTVLHVFQTTGAASFSNNTSGSGTVAVWNRAAAGDNSFVTFWTEAAPIQRGSITYNRGGGVVAYNTTSDVRLKKNIRNSSEASNIIDAIQVRAFDWRDSDLHLEYWLVAQELERVYPLAVTQGGDRSDWAIDPSKLVPLIIKELQSIRARLQRAGV